MKDLNSYKELIYLMIDGEAGEVERETLFSAMHDSPALQSEFQNALNINNAAKSYAASADVPPALTEKLFSRAGMAYTAPVNAGAVSAGAATSGFWSNAKTFASGKYGFGLAGLIIGGILMILLTDNSGNTSDANIPVEQSKNISAQSTPNSGNKNALPTVSSEDKSVENNDNFTQAKNPELTYSNNRINEQTGTQDIAPEMQTTQERNAEKYITNPVYPVDNNTIVYNKKYPGVINRAAVLHSGFDARDIPEYGMRPTRERKGFGIEVNSSFYWNLSKETVSPEEIAKLHNMNLFLYYELNENISVGAGIRQETFFAKYRTSDELNRNFIYEQQPNLTNFEIGMRYHPLSLGNLHPFLNLNAGGGEFGYTYRAGAGCEYRFYDDLSFLLQLEYAGLRYNHLSTWYNSKKIGFNYGIKYNF